MDKVIDTIITDAYKFSQKVYNKLLQGISPDEEFFTQNRHYGDCTISIRIQNYEVEKELYSIFLQIRVRGLIITVVFFCNITLDDLRKLVRKKLIMEMDDIKVKMKTLNNFIGELQ